MLSAKTEVFLKNTIQESITKILPITNSGSNRQYYRIFSNSNSFILTVSEFVEESLSFFYFSEIFNKQNIQVPSLIAVSVDKTAYIQEDIGDLALLDFLLKDNYSERSYEFYKKSLSQLANLQISTSQLLDFNNCYDFKKFDKNLVLNDLFYFKDFFVERLNLPYSKNQLILEFFMIADKVSFFDNQYFLFRDFQARNIFIHENKTFFIDYQGGMQGFIGYDLVSLIFQAKANLSAEWQLSLKNHYANFFIEKGFITKEQFENQYIFSKIVRFFQLLGAYGLRGLVEKKQHFLESILHHYKNLEILINNDYLNEYPEMLRLTKFIVSEEGKNHINKLFQNKN